MTSTFEGLLTDPSKAAIIYTYNEQGANHV
jgi:hypothetical protein